MRRNKLLQIRKEIFYLVRNIFYSNIPQTTGARFGETGNVKYITVSKTEWSEIL